MKTNLQKIMQDGGGLRPDALLRFTPEFVADTLTAAEFELSRPGSRGQQLYSRQMIETAIEELISLLDRLDGEPDAENDDPDLEAEEDCEDEEADDSDFEDDETDLIIRRLGY
jgi:hypothetical protein